MKIQILSVATPSQDHKLKDILTNMELEWIRLLNSAFPFGMNENIKGYGNATKVSMNSDVSKHPYMYYKFARKQNKSHTSNFKKRYNKSNNIQPTINAWKNQLENWENKTDFNSIYNFMLNLKKNKLQLICSTISHSINKTLKLILTSFLISSQNNALNIPSDKKPKIRIVMPFLHKIQDSINIGAIFNNNKIRSILKKSLVHDTIPKTIVVYKYNLPYSCSLFNYNKYLKALTIDTLTQSQTQPCSCINYSDLIYAPAGHIITGKADLLNYSKIQSVVKGTKHKYNKELNEPILKSLFDDVISQYCAKMTSTYKNATFNQKEITDQILNNYSYYSHSLFMNNSSYSSDQPPGRCYDNFKFIITPVDKASNNYSFCCTKHYNYTMMKELGINFKNGV
jgi:hypothetical protein